MIRRPHLVRLRDMHDAIDAVAELRGAMAVWLDAAREAGFPIPAARYRPQDEAAE